MTKEKIIVGKAAKYYNYLERLWDSIANLYNYNYLKAKDYSAIFSLNKDELKEEKSYFINEDIFGVIILNTKKERISEIISLSYRFLEEMGLNITVNLNSNYDYDNINELIDYLDIDYELNTISSSNFDEILFNVTSFHNEILIEGGIIKNNLVFIGNISKIVANLAQINDDRITNNILDVNIKAQNKEEIITGIRLLQDLRWSDIKCDLNDSNNSRITINITNEKLNKGLLEVKDNLTKEEIDIDENEILDYIISNI